MDSTSPLNVQGSRNPNGSLDKHHVTYHTPIAPLTSDTTYISHTKHKATAHEKTTDTIVSFPRQSRQNLMINVCTETVLVVYSTEEAPAPTLILYTHFHQQIPGEMANQREPERYITTLHLNHLNFNATCSNTCCQSRTMTTTQVKGSPEQSSTQQKI